MSNLQALSTSVSNWIKPIIMQAVPAMNIKQPKFISQIASVLGIDLSNYSISKELSFLIDPALNNLLDPMIKERLKFIPEESLPKIVNEFLDAFIKEAQTKGTVNMFGINFEAIAFENLRREFNNHLHK